MQRDVKAISVIGLGKLGSPLAAVMASKGFSVIGVDLNERFVGQLNAGRAPVHEPGLQQLIDASRERLRGTTDIASAILHTDLTFIIVPTPSNEQGVFTNKHVLSAVGAVGEALRVKTGYHVVNITSTVMPGSTDGELRDALERASGRRVGGDVGLCYNPEFIALGTVIRDMLQPDAILIGESDSRAGDALEQVYRRVCGDRTPIGRMNLINAELTKIAVNTYVTTKISYANMLADLCERLPGADVDVVTGALGLDSRIGGKYLKGALGYGGPCFPRDNAAFSALARRLGARPDLAEATDRINSYQVDRLSRLVRQNLASGGNVGVLGLSYKPDTGVIEESQGVALARRMADEGYRVTVYDPQALGSAAAVLRDAVRPTQSLDECIRQVDLLIITTAWPEFRDLPMEPLEARKGRLAIIDCWRILDSRKYGAVARLVYPGKCPDGEQQISAGEVASSAAGG